MSHGGDSSEFALAIPRPDDLEHVGLVLAGWQRDHGPLHLHPGDLGWFSLRGAEATASATRVWTHRGGIVAIALLDGPDLLRFAVDPAWAGDERLAARIVADVTDSSVDVDVAVAEIATIEARGALALGEHLAAEGWTPDEPWIPLRRDLTAPVDDVGDRVEIVAADRTDEWAAVHWSAFRGGPVPDDARRRFVDGWFTAADGPFGETMRILALRDTGGTAVAVAAVWSAGAGRPGLIEPMGVHEEHRGRGYGASVSRAAAALLREAGASSATVCAESSNHGAIATYRAAGFEAMPAVADWSRGEGDGALTL